MTLWFAGQAVSIASVCIAGNLATCSVSCQLFPGGVELTSSWLDLMGLELPLRIERGCDTKRLRAVLEAWDTDGRLEFKCSYMEEPKLAAEVA